MSVDENHRPVEPTSVFPTHAEGFFCTFKVTDAPPNTVITAEWIYVGGEVEEDVGPKFVISKPAIAWKAQSTLLSITSLLSPLMNGQGETTRLSYVLTACYQTTTQRKKSAYL